MSMPKVSVIMPCLNMARYIEECMESVLGQTLDDIEVLVIDAGSTDGTLEVLNNYTYRDKRVRLFHSEKKSYGYQVNMGIAAACGEYIGIVDTDDRVVQDMYEALYEVADRTGADYVKGNACGFYSIQNKFTYRYNIASFWEEKYRAGSIQVVPKDMPELVLKDYYLWYGIYRKDFIKKVKLHESPGAAYQDAGGVLQMLMRAEKAVYIKKMVYEYRNDNMSASEYNPKAFELVLNEYDWNKRYLEGESLQWQKAFYKKWLSHILGRFDIMAVSDCFQEDALDTMNKIKEEFGQAMEKGIFQEEDLDESYQRRLRLFMKDPRELYEELRKVYLEGKNKVYEVMQAVKGKETVIFGSGRLGTFLHLQMLHNDIDNVVAFCDTNASVEKVELHERPVLRPEEAVFRYPEATYIIANKNSVQEMREHLLRLGVDEKKIFYYTSGTDHRLFRTRMELADI